MWGSRSLQNKKMSTCHNIKYCLVWFKVEINCADYWIRISDYFVVIFLKTEVKSLHGHDAIAEFISWDQGTSNEAKDAIKAAEVIASCPLHDNCVSSHTPCLTVCTVTYVWKPKEQNQRGRPLLRNSCVNTFPRQQIRERQYRNWWRIVTQHWTSRIQCFLYGPWRGDRLDKPEDRMREETVALGTWDWMAAMEWVVVDREITVTLTPGLDLI
jgi:hypothetical protein